MEDLTKEYVGYFLKENNIHLKYWTENPHLYDRSHGWKLVRDIVLVASQVLSEKTTEGTEC